MRKAPLATQIPIVQWLQHPKFHLSQNFWCTKSSTGSPWPFQILLCHGIIIRINISQFFILWPLAFLGFSSCRRDNIHGGCARLGGPWHGGWARLGGPWHGGHWCGGLRLWGLGGVHGGHWWIILKLRFAGNNITNVYEHQQIVPYWMTIFPPSFWASWTASA